MPPDSSRQQHNNQTMDKTVWDQTTREGCMDGSLDLPFLPCWYCKHHGEKGFGIVLELKLSGLRGLFGMSIDYYTAQKKVSSKTQQKWKTCMS